MKALIEDIVTRYIAEMKSYHNDDTLRGHYRNRLKEIRDRIDKALKEELP